MRPILLALLAATAGATPPPLAPHAELGVSVDVPAEWKVLVDPNIHNVTMSAGLAQSITLYWYDYRPGATSDVLLDILVTTVQQQLPIGEAKELSREPIPGMHEHDLVRGKRMHAQVDALGYSMRLGLVTLIDQPNGRMIAAFLVSPPDGYDELGGVDLLTDVVTSLRLDADAPLPAPGWWWNAQPPAALAPGVVEVAAK